MKFNVLVVTPLILSTLLATASVRATNPNMGSEEISAEVRSTGAGNEDSDTTSATRLSIPEDTKPPTTVGKSEKDKITEEFRELLRKNKELIM
ncbi:hypothetical protein IWQ61_010416, partial [Dispira simplex]